MKVTMAWANFTPNSRRYVNDVLKRGWLSRSKYIPRFEKAVASRHRAKHGILVSSGTDALRISLAILKEASGWPDGAGVLVPAVTFAATVNAVLQNRLIPVFADVDEFTCNLSLNLPLPKDVRAVIPVHLFGLPTTIPKIGVPVVEDSCETFGVHKLTGDLACFSFYLSHHVSCGVGGMILTNSRWYAEIARSLANHGRIDDGSHFQFGRSGYSSRVTEMEAALGCAALEHFDEDLEQRRKLATVYMDCLNIPHMQRALDDSRHSWMFFAIRLLKGNRDKLLLHLRKNEIESREAMPLLNQPFLKKLYKPGSCPVAEDWTKNGLLLPLHPKMSEQDVEFVCEKVKTFFN